MVRFLSSGPRGRGQIRRDAKAKVKVSMETSRSDRLKDRISNLKAALIARDEQILAVKKLQWHYEEIGFGGTAKAIEQALTKGGE